MQIEGLDALDNKILEVIKDNARLSYKDIGDLVGISRVSVKNRMDAMQAKGVIKGYQTVIDPEKAAEGTHFMVDLTVTPEHYEEIVAYLAGSKYIRKIYSLSGDCSIHAEGYISNPRNMEVFANTLYRTEKEGIRQLKMSTVLSVMMDLDGGVEYEQYQEHEHLEERGE